MIKNIKSGNLVCVLIDIHLWSGRQALKREHLIASNPSLHELPPSDLASMGSVRICDPEEVRAFQRIKNEAIRVVEENGLPFLGAFGVPEDRFDDVYLKLTDIGHRFDARAHDLLQRYDVEAAKWKAKWQSENPAHAHLLTRMPDAQTVVGKLKFGFHAYAIQPPSGDGLHDANKQFDTQLKGLKGELLSDAAKEASDLLTKYLVSQNGKRERITQKTLRPFKRISNKLRSFGFVDPSIAPLADVIDSVLQSLPSQGAIEGASLISVWNLASMLSNPVVASRMAESSLAVGADNALRELDNPVDYGGSANNLAASDGGVEGVSVQEAVTLKPAALPDFGFPGVVPSVQTGVAGPLASTPSTNVASAIPCDMFM